MQELFQDSVFCSIGIIFMDVVSTYYHVLPHLTLIWMTLLIDINIMQLQKSKVQFEKIRNVERISVEILRAFDLLEEIKENFHKYFNFTTLFWSFSTFSHILSHMNFLWDNPGISEVVDTSISCLVIWWWTTELQKVTREINMFLNELKQSPPKITAYQFFVIDKNFFIALLKNTSFDFLFKVLEELEEEEIKDMKSSVDGLTISYPSENQVQVPYMKHIKRSGNWDELQLKSNYKPKRWKIVLRHFIICIIFAITDIKYYFEYDEEAKKIDFSKCFIHQHAQNSVIYYIGITLVDISGSCYHVLPHLTLIWMTLLIDVNIMQLQELEVKFEEIRNVERISVEILRAFHIIAEIKENFAKYFSFTTLIWSFASFLHILGHMNVIWDNPEVTEVIDTVISILIIWWWTTELQKLTQEVDSLKNVIAKLCFLELNFREKHFQQINMFLNELKQSPPQITAYQYFVIDKKFFIVVISTLATYSIILFQFH
ncbi:hypothetical protein GQR58_023683 [Nymphon striatum]|nr:hypothetical protein GQR58_023683 [Nymphon striatum]KAG1656943.1 hypothetical protein GQR58_023683 [Nymphon striatum]